jgi:hypothetical protein
VVVRQFLAHPPLFKGIIGRKLLFGGGNSFVDQVLSMKVVPKIDKVGFWMLDGPALTVLWGRRLDKIFEELAGLRNFPSG